MFHAIKDIRRFRQLGAGVTVGYMSNRDPACGVLEQNRGSARRPVPDDCPANPPGSDRVTTPIVLSTTPTVPEPTRTQRVPGGVALDALDDDERPPARTKPGWRELVSRVPGINLGPRKAQSYELQLADRVRGSVETVFPIAVFNLKGDVGTTTVVEALGSTFADVRADRVIAVDLDAGDLADRHGHRSSLGIFDLVADGTVAQYLDVRSHTYMNAAGLEVLGVGSDTDRKRVKREEFAKAFEKLRHHYPVVLTDCGKTLKSGVVSAALRRSRAIVLVSSASIDAIRRTRTTLEWLRNNGYQSLLTSMVLAVNHIEAGKPDAAVYQELEKMSRQFPAARVIMLPFDRHLADGSGITLERLSKESRRSYLEMAAALADLFPSSSMTLAGAAQR